MSEDRSNALRLIEGIENGTLTPSDAADLVEKIDPTLVYLTITWFRKRYTDHVNADSVVGRLVELTKYPAVAERMKEGQADSIVEWFEDAYSYRKLEAKELVDTVVDKLES